MSTTTSNLAASAPARVTAGALKPTFSRLRTTFNDGESLWTPVLVVAIGFAVVFPIFLFLIGIDFAAYFLAGG